MNREQFKNELAKELTPYMNETMKYSFEQCLLGEIPTDILRISFANTKRFCCIPMHILYGIYSRGLIMEEIADFIIQSTLSMHSLDLSKVVFRLVNVEENEELLCNAPHVSFHDMAIVFMYYMPNKRKNPLMLITNEVMHSHQLTLQKLTDHAHANTFVHFPASISLSIVDQFERLFTSSTATLKDYEEFANDAYFSHNHPSIFRLTCKDYHYGATALLDIALLSKQAEKWGQDLLIISGSEKEFFLVPCPSELKQEYVNEILQLTSFGETQTALSSKVFLFRKDANILEEIIFENQEGCSCLGSIL